MGRSKAREWEDIEPGRCKHLRLHIPPSSSPLSLSVSVLDAPSHFEASNAFAALLVPRGQELDWVFCARNGLWDLLFSASVSRLVVLRRLTHLHQGEDLSLHPHLQAVLWGKSVSDRGNVDDASLKESLTSLLRSLFPWSICPHGPALDPYVTYEDDVRTRVVVEMRHSEALGGGILVEDVELNCSLDDGTSTAAMDVNKHERILRRRMRFQQMPNLIQTEVPIAIYKGGQLTCMYGLDDVKAAQEKLVCNRSAENGSVMEERVSEVELEVQLDHSKLVHKYLPPIVAGLVLASPCLDACVAAGVRARVLTIGLGGGALPVFLQRQFDFSVTAVDTHETVVDLARHHFGLVESEHLQVQVKDGMDVVFCIAHEAFKNNRGAVEVLKDWQAACKASAQGEIISELESTDTRMHVIIVDVNVDDACSGLLSPPACFLSKTFLLAVRLALHEGGVLVINVIPRIKQNFNIVVNSLRAVFAGIYQIRIEDNHVIFAFPSKIADINMSCVFALSVANAIGDVLFDKIEEVEDPIDI